MLIFCFLASFGVLVWFLGSVCVLPPQKRPDCEDLSRVPRLCLRARIFRYPFSCIHFRFSSDLSLGVKPYNSIDLSITRSVRLFFPFSTPSLLTRVVTKSRRLNKHTGVSILSQVGARTGTTYQLSRVTYQLGAREIVIFLLAFPYSIYVYFILRIREAIFLSKTECVRDVIFAPCTPSCALFSTCDTCSMLAIRCHNHSNQ